MLGVIKDLSNKDYHAAEGISKSNLDKIEISPAHFLESQEHEQPQTDAMVFGTLFHTTILEPEKLETEFAIEPKVNKRTNEGKAILEQFYNENQDKTIVSQEQMQLAQILKQNIMAHPIANKLLSGNGENEQSMFWVDKETGVLCKIRPDRIKNNIIIDLKTTTCAKPGVFDKKAFEYGYHKQAYLYKEGYEQVLGKKPDGFVFIAIEKEPPFAVCVFEASEEFTKIGELEAKANLKTYKQCVETNTWNGYENIIHSLEVPAWIKNKHLEELNDD